MKRLILGCISLLVCFNCLGGEVRINLKAKHCTDNRSISIIPTVTYDGNVISLYSDNVTFENLEMTVKNSIGQIVYHSFLTVKAGEPCFCPLYNLEQEEYSVELSIKNDLYCGNFLVE